MTKPAGPFFTLPNLLSLSRLLLVPVFIILAFQEGASVRWLLAAIIIYGIASDIADGLIARYTKKISDWGKVVDPLSDKIGTATVGWYVWLRHDFPIWAFILLISKDLAILVAGIATLSRTAPVPVSNFLGKTAALLWAVTVLAYFVEVSSMKAGLLYAATAATIPALVSYGKRWQRQKKEALAGVSH